MQTATTIGLDIAKSVFQVHGVDAGGQVVIGAGEHPPSAPSSRRRMGGSIGPLVRLRTPCKE
jgi:hypothetical protein